MAAISMSAIETRADRSAAVTFISSSGLGRVISADSLVCLSEHNGSTRAQFTDGTERHIWQRGHTEFAKTISQHLPVPLVEITTGSAVRRSAFVNLTAITGWSGTTGALHLHTHGATVILAGFDIRCMTDGLAAAGHMVRTIR